MHKTKYYPIKSINPDVEMNYLGHFRDGALGLGPGRRSTKPNALRMWDKTDLVQLPSYDEFSNLRSTSRSFKGGCGDCGGTCGSGITFAQLQSAAKFGKQMYDIGKPMYDAYNKKGGEGLFIANGVTSGPLYTNAYKNVLSTRMRYGPRSEEYKQAVIKLSSTPFNTGGNHEIYGGPLHIAAVNELSRIKKKTGPNSEEYKQALIKFHSIPTNTGGVNPYVLPGGPLYKAAANELMKALRDFGDKSEQYKQAQKKISSTPFNTGGVNLDVEYRKCIAANGPTSSYSFLTNKCVTKPVSNNPRY